MTDSSRLLLDQKQIAQKVIRIAYEIYERNFEQEAIILAGVLDRGYHLAELIAKELDKVSHFSSSEGSLKLVKVSLKKFTQQQTQVTFNVPVTDFDGNSIVLVDDVLNTGRTLAYCIPSFLERSISKLEIAVLVNRSHIQFPVMANYTGLELATTLQEHIEVVFKPDSEGVYLH
ncbi:phosphoribosyltransferase family protein [Tunicatimonas pelagia]|uniref:phosphoribosyltransferase family protein n=1 Tax=Tunicatimonas pelagia TaxID=931531 RepID=UPI002666D64F|nr:phosphoribosyltransferase family protein [Tunicatimonas pelagia]WKN44437.1 phosphoribosyltransferase family protein [Tunicatimonas pelagia]